MDTTNDIYLNYHAMTGEITEGLSRMAKFCDELGMEDRAESLRVEKKKLQSHKFAVGILGEFKRGKSTVINALLGKEIMPADILPSTATMNRVTYDLQPGVQLNMIDGTTNRIGVEELAEYVTKRDENTLANAALIEEAVVFYPCRFCQNGVDIIDTPGLNDDERMNKITEEIVPKLDAVIMVLVPDNPFSMSEADFVRNKLMCSNIGRLIFLVNKIDTVRPRDRARVVEGIRTKIEKSVLEKTAEVYGLDSEQYQLVKQKIADIRIYPISAQDALDGRVGVCDDPSEDEKMTAQSGILDFEEALSKLLTEERGFLELGAPLGSILNTAKDAKEKIQTYLNAMDAAQETFLEAQRENLAAQQKIRSDKEAEKSNMRQRSKTMGSSLSGKADAVYLDIEKTAMGIIDQMTLADPNRFDDAIKQAMIEDTMKSIEAVSTQKMSGFCERMAAEIDEIVGHEAIKVSEFVGKSKIRLTDAQNIFLQDVNERKTTNMIDAAGIIVDVITDFAGIYGIGGIVSGFRAAGVKGALLGGGVGLAANLGLAAALASVGIVGLPLVLISCAAGTGVSKVICNTVFKKSKNESELAKLKENLKKGVQENFDKLRQTRVLETWVNDTITAQFDALCNAMDEQCEAAIHEAEDVINKIKLDLARSTAEKEAAKKNYLSLSESIDGLISNIEPVRQKLLQCS